jgi:HTH-type transcriptional regulator/antitoxin HipB
MDDIDKISPLGYIRRMVKHGKHAIRSIRQAGSALKSLRQSRKITQKQLADRTGTAQSTISDIETGVVSVSLDVYLRLLEALGSDLTVSDRITDTNLA